VSFPLASDADEALALTDAEFQRRLKRLLPNDRDYVLVHRWCWRIHQRVTRNFCHGRVVLVGDAAHINSPHGGMGMNSAIHDAVSLSEKLEKISHRAASADLLDLYARQRRHVALEDVRVQSMRNSKLMNERDETKRRDSLDQVRQTANNRARANLFAGILDDLWPRSKSGTAIAEERNDAGFPRGGRRLRYRAVARFRFPMMCSRMIWRRSRSGLPSPLIARSISRRADGRISLKAV
jgi:flavin-dependent dehydrogenase